MKCLFTLCGPVYIKAVVGKDKSSLSTPIDSSWQPLENTTKIVTKLLETQGKGHIK